MSDWTAFDDCEHFMEGFVSDWTAFDDCEHFMGIVCPTGPRLMIVNTLWGVV